MKCLAVLASACFFLVLFSIAPAQAGIVVNSDLKPGDTTSIEVCASPEYWSGDELVAATNCRSVTSVLTNTPNVYETADGTQYRLDCVSGPAETDGLSALPSACNYTFIGKSTPVVPTVDSTSGVGLVPACPVGQDGCANPYDPDNYGTCEIVALGNNLIQFFVGMGALFATITFVYAGYLLVMSQGNPGQITRAKEMFTTVVIGFVILLSAFLIVNTILRMMVGQSSSIMNWNSIECSYSNKAGDALAQGVKVGKHVNGIYLQEDWTVVTSGAGRYSAGVGGGGGSCSVVTSQSNACHPSKLTCFGDTQEASKVCNLESSGGQIKAVSGSDLCQDGFSFSGGLFQINVLANYDKIPGCNGTFFEKNGSSAQGNCLREVTNSNGVRYCAVRDCKITNETVYNQCMGQIMNASTNLQIACNLYRADGWDPWMTSAKACGVY